MDNGEIKMIRITKSMQEDLPIEYAPRVALYLKIDLVKLANNYFK